MVQSKSPQALYFSTLHLQHYLLSSALLALPLTNFITLQRVPDVAVKVVISSKYEAAWHRQGQWCHSTVHLAILVAHHFLIRADVKHLKGTVVWASHKSVSIIQELEEKGSKDHGVIQYSWTFHTIGIIIIVVFVDCLFLFFFSFRDSFQIV